MQSQAKTLSEDLTQLYTKSSDTKKPNETTLSSFASSAVEMDEY